MDEILNIYIDQEKKEKTIRSLRTFGAETFKGATSVENLSELKKILNQHKTENNKSTLLERIQPFLWDRLIDDIRITLSFENILKSQLIENQFLVHFVKGKSSINQNTTPLPLTDFKAQAKRDPSFRLRPKTISLSSILESSEYRAHVSVPSRILNRLKEMNQDRNRLHLVESYFASYNDILLDDLYLMNQYIDRMVQEIKDGA